MNGADAPRGEADLEAARLARMLLAAPSPAAADLDRAGVLRAILTSSAFSARALWSLQEGDLEGRFLGERVPADLVVWAAEVLPLSAEGCRRLERAGSRGEVLRAVLADPEFRSAVPEADAPEIEAALEGADRRSPAGAGAVALLCAVCDPDPADLDAFTRSVFAQDVGDWELCLCDHGSTDPGSRYALERLRGGDARVRLSAVAAEVSEAGAVAAAALTSQSAWAWRLPSLAPLRSDAVRAAHRSAAPPLVPREALLNLG